jgi:hypothetical protein
MLDGCVDVYINKIILNKKSYLSEFRTRGFKEKSIIYKAGSTPNAQNVLLRCYHVRRFWYGSSPRTNKHVHACCAFVRVDMGNARCSARFAYLVWTRNCQCCNIAATVNTELCVILIIIITNK